jgi:site-specific DNA-methyltransferase (adenine-specific)
VKPYYDQDGIQIWHADCRDVLPTLADDSVDFTITDPPYGFRKADWDGEFPTFWLDDAARISRQAIAIMPGINNLFSLPRRIGAHEYRWTLSVHLSNGMTRGLMGFGNWIPVLVYGRDGISLYQPQQDATAVPVIGEMPDHPSPKPLRAMSWIVSRFGEGLILDPFMGSGTTLRAAKDLGRRAIGIEIEERYCEIAVKRLQQQVLPLVLT